jgi:hypothetical protein
MKNLYSFLLAIFFTINGFAQQALLEPATGCVYHGAQLMTYDNPNNPLAGYLGALNDSNIYPAVRGYFMGIPSERGPANPLLGLKKFLLSADSIGFIPEVSFFLVDSLTATDSVIAVSNTYDWIIDSAITFCKEYNKRMFLRIGGEFNGQGPGWNGGGYHHHLYVTMFRKIVDMFAARGFRDSIATNWCYEPAAANDFDSVDANGPLWYPGDNYVDWFGLDVFVSSDFDQGLPDYVGNIITKKGKSERFLDMTKTRGKPVYLSETSAQGVNITANITDGINDWNNWFAKFWQFIDVHKEIKGFSYINANWPQSAYPNWGDARIQNNSYITDQYRLEMKKTKYIHQEGTGCLAAAVSDLIPPYETVRVHPNPAGSILNIEMNIVKPGNYSIILCNNLGQIMNRHSAKFSIGLQKLQFDCSRNPGGVYYLQLRGSSSPITTKLVVNR